MKFYENQLFHIYNQSNSGELLFRTDDNYHYFLWKMRAYLLPFGDIISWCLMPTHFHWQFYVKQVSVSKEVLNSHLNKIEYWRRKAKYGKKALPIQESIQQPQKEITLNRAIGDLEVTYTRAFNKGYNKRGSLFRSHCKAKDGWIDEFVSLNRLDGQLDNRFHLGNDYAYRCLSYIHENPVNDGLVTLPTDYVFSSAMDYAGLRKGTLCNMELGKRLMKEL